MEASSVPQENAPEPAGTEQIAPDPPASENAAREAAQPPDMSEQFSALKQEIEGLRADVLPQQLQSDQGLYDALIGQETYQQQPQEAYQQPHYGQPQQAQPPAQPQAGDDRERVAEDDPLFQHLSSMAERLDRFEQDQRVSQLEELANEHPELLESEFQGAIRERLDDLAERFGDQARTDPDLVELALVAEKAARASANEVPAEQAATEGAKLESAAGAASPEATTPEQAIVQDILNAGGENPFSQ